MPRVGRFAVEFTVADDPKVWRADFIHHHAKEHCPHLGPRGFPLHQNPRCSHHDDRGRAAHPAWECPKPQMLLSCPWPTVTPVEWLEPETHKLLKLRHLTTVKLRHKGSPVFLSGHAPCSLADEYNWQRGLHYALQQALEKGKHCKLQKITTKEASILWKRPIGAVIVTERKPTYGQIMEAFWREMRVRPSAKPSTTEALVALVDSIDSRRRALAAPPVHGMGAVELDGPIYPYGTYHLGAD